MVVGLTITLVQLSHWTHKSNYTIQRSGLLGCDTHSNYHTEHTIIMIIVLQLSNLTLPRLPRTFTLVTVRACPHDVWGGVACWCHPGCVCVSCTSCVCVCVMYIMCVCVMYIMCVCVCHVHHITRPHMRHTHTCDTPTYTHHTPTHVNCSDCS